PLGVRFSGNLQNVPEAFLGRPLVRPDVVRRGKAEIERRAAVAPSAESLHQIGLLQLAEGAYTKAVLSLEQAARQSPGDARVENDLSAALLVRSEAEHRSLDLVKSLEVLDRAPTDAPTSIESLFNRAEVLTRLHLRRAARAAWARYLQSDRRSQWAEA